MPPALRVGDTSNHGGAVMGPGVPSVVLEGKVAAVAQDRHMCAIPPPHAPASSPFMVGSSTVLIGGKPALRVGDPCGCGASGAIGASTVLIG